MEEMLPQGSIVTIDSVKAVVIGTAGTTLQGNPNRIVTRYIL